MTETVPLLDFVREFRHRLPDNINQQLQGSETLMVRAQKSALNGWTPTLLATECSRNIGGGVINPAAIVMSRLNWTAEHAPAKPHKPQARPFCSDQCRDQQGWIEDDNCNRIRKCDCRTTKTNA